MSSTTLILIVVVLVLLLVAALLVGNTLAKRRRIDLSKPPERPEGEAERPPGGYRAGGGITFSAGTRPPPPAAPGDVAPPPIVEPTIPEARRPEPSEEPSAEPIVPEAPPAAVTREAPAGPEAPVEAEAPAEPEAPVAPVAPVEAEAPVEPEIAAEAAAPEVIERKSTEAAPAPPPTAEAPPIEPTTGRLERLRGRLSRSRGAFGQSLLGLLGAGDLDEDSWTEVEDTLLMADLGAATATEIVDTLRTELVARGVRTPQQARTLLREVLTTALHPDMDRSVHALPSNGRPAVVLIAGVNGTGKTTTTGKLARVLVADGRRVLLGAADTFRAAAVDQLQTWAQRVGAEVVRGKEGADPASVAFEAVKRGTAVGVDAVLLDTAGRLHTKTGLMDELGKVKRVVERQAEVNEVLLVLDATTGQNGLVQAKVFAEVVDVSGIVLTKLDGTAKGGIVFRVQRELGVPVKLVGLGEGPDDLAPFEPAAFVDALLD